ncbi:hypothetical protein D3C80_2172250 [compost metagenome]
MRPYENWNGIRSAPSIFVSGTSFRRHHHRKRQFDERIIRWQDAVKVVRKTSFGGPEFPFA